MKLAGAGAALLALLTACPRTYPPYVAPLTLNFSFPDTPASADLRLAAIYFEQATPGGPAAVKVLSMGYVGGSGGSGASVNTATLSLYADSLNTVKSNPLCISAFKTGEASGMQSVVVSPDTVKTCNVYFTLFRDRNSNNSPESTEELYLTHDIYSYANSAFTYSFTSPDSRSTESGTRTNGWSLVRHEVLQPTATPDRYVVSMNSVPTADLGIAIRMHVDSDRLTSMGVRGGLK